MYKVFISTAEASAELHASHLVDALRRHHPTTTVNAAGSQILATAGANVIVDMSGRAVMGFWEALGQISFYRNAVNSILNKLEQEKHDALVLVDAPSFNLHLARSAKKRWPDLPILYYIAPKLWAWKEWRVKNLRRDVDRTLCIFPFEVDFFRERGVNAVFVGNPTLDQLRDVTGKDMTRHLRVEDVKRHSDPARGVMAVFPGSRKSEIKYIWPIMTKTIAILTERFPELKVAVALAPDWTEERLAAFAPLPPNTSFIHGDSHELLAAASVVLAKSGTTTLEAALLGKPMAVCYAGHPASFYIAKMFVKLPYVSLPNILAGKRIVEEFLQGDASPENLADELGRLLSDQRHYRKMRQRLRDLRHTLGDEYAAEQASTEIEKYCEHGITTEEITEN